MTPSHQLLELTDRELSSVHGGFLPLLGLLGMGANLAGSIMGGIGKKKAQEAQQITADASAQGGQGNGQPSGDSGQPPAGSGNLLGQPAQLPSSGCTCCSGG